MGAISERLPDVITVEQRDGSRFHVIHAELSCRQVVTDDDLDAPQRLRALTLGSNTWGDESVLWKRDVFEPVAFEPPRASVIARMSDGPDRVAMFAWFSGALSPVYCGHTTVQRPFRFGRLVNLDTGANLAEEDNVGSWPGLTLTEPSTNRFWTARKAGVVELHACEVVGPAAE
jgi:hypothetical protein